jgi:hypothetical protein
LLYLIFSLMFSAFVYYLRYLLREYNKKMEHMTLTEENGTYHLHYTNHQPIMLASFYFRGLQAGGYTWEAILLAGIRQKNKALLDSLHIDPEGDGLFFSSEDKAVAEETKAILDRAINNVFYREYCIVVAYLGGYLE